MSSKYDRIVRLSTHVIRKDVLCGHLKWKVTDLARSSRVARSVIYELLGKNKNEMLLNALEVLLKELYGLSPERQQAHKTMSRFQAFLRSRSFVIEAPELLSFYFRNRVRQDVIGKSIREHEKQYLAAVAKQTGIRNPANLLFVRTIIHGISVAPFLNDEEVRDCMGKLAQIIEQE